MKRTRIIIDKPVYLEHAYLLQKVYLLTWLFNKTALGAADDKIIRSIDTMETYAYGTNEELRQKNEET